MKIINTLKIYLRLKIFNQVIISNFSYQFMTSENAGKAIDIMGSKTNGTLPKVPGMRGGVSDFFSSES